MFRCDICFVRGRCVVIHDKVLFLEISKIRQLEIRNFSTFIKFERVLGTFDVGVLTGQNGAMTPSRRKIIKYTKKFCFSL